ncbi:MAG: peptidase S8 and S53 subtilisin kexin sedolisin [Thiothrix sp.]|nr:MAG: peptidase S8 and S53 subtilisin kexin sedolisin [Thiothrix sp.]
MIKNTYSFRWILYKYKVSLLFLACALGNGIAWSQPNIVAEQATELMSVAIQKGKVRVIVGLREPAAGLNESQRRLGLESAQTTVLGKLQNSPSFKPETVKRFTVVSGMALEADLAALQALASDPNVVSIQEDVAIPPTLYQSIPLIDADNAWSMGYSGAGQTVAILDTGVNKSHPMLSGKIVSEACYSTSSSISSSLCPGGVGSSTATGSGVNCTSSISSCNHGTHVAGIAAGKNGSTSSTGTFHGVARDANIIAIQIFSRFNNSSDCEPSPAPCVLTYTSDQIRGLERVYALRNTYSIAAANMSIGGGAYESTCDSDSRKTVIDLLSSAGIATVIAAGNNGFSNMTNAPGCISTAITVGSTTKFDSLSDFSNNASWVDLMAPGSSILSSVISGYASYYGTSMATPHVAGAWAVMKSKNSLASVSSIQSALQNNGISISTPAGTKRRIDLDNALASMTLGPQLGLNWDHCQKAYRDLYADKTWCYLESSKIWIWVNDNEGEDLLIKAASSNHWLGYYVSSIKGSSFLISHLQLYKN